MKKFLKKLLNFMLVPLLVYAPFMLFVMPGLIKKTNGPSTKEQIMYTFDNALKRDYDVLIAGNSRFYRGINPDMFTQKAYNFSCDNDTYNQLYYKLLFLEKNKKKYTTLVLGVDYFQFSFISDTRNYVYTDMLGDEYAADYKANRLLQNIRRELELLSPKQFRGLRFGRAKPFIKPNGQFIRAGTAKKDDFVQRDITRLDVQVKYFEKILAYCKQRNIKVYLVMMPVRENELKSYKQEELDEFHAFLKKYTNENNTLLDYSLSKEYTLSDYTDITHLNEKAADRFSMQLNGTINSISGKPLQ